MDPTFGWGVVLNDGGFWQGVLPKLQYFESMTWTEIVGKRHHAIPFGSLSREAKQRLTELNMDDIEEVFSLALGGRERVVGIRDRGVFRVLWWDPEHRVCLSHKKHT